jgi:hypothetical protein
MVHQSDRDPRPGDDRLAIGGPALIPAVCFASLSGCSRQRWRLVCVPLRHVLPIRVSRLWGASDPITLVKPFVRRETVAAGRGFVPARARHPGAGPASPDIASSGVSEGGTGIRVRREKWAGMKKICFVDFVGRFLEFVPLALRELRGFWRLARSYLPLAGETSWRWPKARNRSSESISANGGLSATPREGCERNWPDQGQTLRFRKRGAR